MFSRRELLKGLFALPVVAALPPLPKLAAAAPSRITGAGLNDLMKRLYSPEEISKVLVCTDVDWIKKTVTYASVRTTSECGFSYAVSES